MAPQTAIGTFTGRQPPRGGDPSGPLYETCWVWRPSTLYEVWALYRGPDSAFPYVEPGPANPEVWLRLDFMPETTFPDKHQFLQWIVDHLTGQGRPCGLLDLDVQIHTVY